MRVFKAHGLGNDYLVLESGEPLNSARIRWLCDRHQGVGSDGLLEPFASTEADRGVRIWNPDGSRAEKSGNGLRIFAHWCARNGAGSAFKVDTGFGIVACRVLGSDRIEVEMGQATVAPEAIGLQQSTAWVDHPLALSTGDVRPATAVSVGNPHCVLFTTANDLDAEPWRSWGASLEVDPRFRNRTNVQLARVVGPGQLELRIHERGAGPTLASGSSSCAAVAAAVLTERSPPGLHEVIMPGGKLQVSCRKDLHLTLTGPVSEVGWFDVSERSALPALST